MDRRYGWIIVGLLAVLVGVWPVGAKGASDRIILTGPTIDGEMVLTDRQMVFPLSFGSLEDWRAGKIDEPANPGSVYYELQRQYQMSADSYQTFDRLRFYPGEGSGPGYVYYIGLDNGWSEYDKHWFHANPWAKTALETVLDKSARPYVVAMSDTGNIHLLDPRTLADMQHFKVLDYPRPMLNFVDGLDTQTVYFDTRQSTIIEHHRVDLAAGTECWVDTLPQSSGELLGDLWVAGEFADRLSKTAAGTWFEPIRTLNDHVLLYHPLGRYRIYDYGAQDRGEISGGIAVVRMADSKITDTWQSQLDFAQVIAGGDSLYAIHAPRDSDLTEIYALNVSSGNMLASHALDSSETWTLGYAVLDLSAVAQTPTIEHIDTCDYHPWELPQMFRFTPQLLSQ